MDRFRTLPLAVFAFVVLAAVTIIGLVWLSLGVASWLTHALPHALPELLVGVLFLLPGCVFALAHVVSGHAARRQSAAARDAEMSQTSRDDVAKIADLARGYAQQSPLAALVIAAAAGFVATRYPSVIRTMADVLTGAGERR